MNSPIIQLLVLAGIAVFLILRLKNVLGTRDGFESPREVKSSARKGPALEVITGGPDPDIADHVADPESDMGVALSKMKAVEPSFGVSDFLQGAKGAYEMILMSFEKGDLTPVKSFLSEDVQDAFQQVIDAREEQGLTVEAEFIGVRETTLQDATFDAATREGEVTVRFAGELSYVVRNAEGQIVEGSDTQIKRQKDVWTFARVMGSDDPNWQLVATGE
ncbi:Tim44/TimA family putative adaptor protein [Cognatishimia sp. SS12]|uniref:Tim44/TimA family putative adaptor protein n=1 Tax=Cognatishimia sp. SS12 TaxID=2979465 RepID=UPI00232EC00A|nr:Tim44/TimA family putative adaptor protein [Cognatishimia sp. SS12]MDC0737748.1 Tim44/TimA family putative adaptor protein [Cognatishimia sp. SS12]